jgi:uncharacterized membrane protein
MLSCKDVAHLASQAMEAPLTWRQRWGMRLHLLFCGLCRHYVGQLRFLERAFERVRNCDQERLSSGERLPEEARKRIRRTLRDEKPS